MSEFAIRVLEEILKQVKLPDDVARLVYLLMEREVETEYPTLMHINHWMIHNDKETRRTFETYAFTAYSSAILSVLKRLPRLHHRQFMSTIGELAGLSDEHIYSFANLPCREFRALDSLPKEVSKFNGNFIEFVPQLFKDLLNFRVPFGIPNRFEHTHILGATGTGKTQLIQTLIAHDLGEKASIVVIDSQGDMLRTILSLKSIDPQRLVIIDPHDVEYPLALNIFDIGQERIQQYSQLDYERHINGVIELLSFVFSSILGAELTQKQGVALNFVLRLMLFIPNATIHTLRDILTPKGLEPYAIYVSKLTESGQAFFRNEFNSKAFDDTKTQVIRRLYGLLENPTIERLFSHPSSKFDMKKEMDAGKIILINTAKDLLKGQGCTFFGRFFISLVAQATQERAASSFRRPTYVYIDEAQDYLDSNVATLLEQARKYNVGITLAHQQLAQLPADIQSSVRTNTATKFVGACSASDARSLAEDMRCEPSFLMNQSKLHFATYAKDYTKRAISIAVQPGRMERQEKRNDAELERIIQDNRAQYSVSQKHIPTHVADMDSDDDIESFNKT